MSKTPSVDAIFQMVEGKRIVKLTSEGLELEDGTKLTWQNESDVGLDGGCYEWLRIRINGRLVYNL